MTGPTWGVTVYGPPVPKGSMRCIGGKGRRHQLIDDKRDRLAPWEAALTRGAAALARHLTGQAPLTGPVRVDVTFTLARPRTVSRAQPTTRNTGDVDKLSRALLDALTAGGVWGDDSQATELTARKRYAGTPGALDRPGAVIHITPLGTDR